MSKNTTKRVSSFVAGFIAIAMVFSVAMPANASHTVEHQIQELLAQIAALQAQLDATSGTPAVSGANCRPNGHVWGTTLNIGSRGNDVMVLQRMLNQNPATQLVGTATSLAGTPGNETDYYGNRTATAVGKYQALYASSILTPIGLSASNVPYPFGPATRSHANGLPVCGSVVVPPPTDPTNPVPTGAVSVSLSPQSTSGSALVAGQAIANVGTWRVYNGSASAVNITNMQFTQNGVANDSTLANVYLYEGANRLTDAASVSVGTVNFNQPSGLFTVPAGTYRDITVRTDVATGTAGQIIALRLDSASASGVAASGVPVQGPSQSIASATMATADWSATTLPTGNTDVEPQNDYVVWQNTVTVNTRAVDLQSFALRQIGSMDTGDVINFRLQVNGQQVGSTVPMVDSNGYVTFDLRNAPVRLETGGRTIKVLADIVGGASNTFSFSLRQASDAMMIDTSLLQPVLATDSSGTSFDARTTGTKTIASSSGGNVTVSKSSSSPTGNVTLNATNVKLATFDFRASGERMKIENLDVNVNTTGGPEGGIDNGRVFVNGVQVGSTKDLTEGTDVNFTFGSSFIINPGQTAIVDIYGDMKTTTAASYGADDTVTVTVGTGSSNAQGLSSLQSRNIPSSDTAANTLTMKAGTLTATKFSGYGDQTFVAGTNNARLGSFVLSAGSTEGVNVNTITIALDSSPDEAGTVTNMWIKDRATGNQVGPIKATPSTSNAFSVNIDIPASGTKTYDLIANIISGSDAGTWQATVDADGTGLTTGSASNNGAAVALQTMTIGSASISASRSGSNPSNANQIAGGSAFLAGAFRFTAENADVEVQELLFKVDNGAATSVSSVTIKYQDVNGTTIQKESALSVSSSDTAATATFTGLTMHVPKDSSATVEVWIESPTIANGAVSGRAITVDLDWNNGFKAQPSGGSAITSVGSADLTSDGDSGRGTMYIKKSYPVITPLANSGSPATSQPIYKFTVTANSAGDIEIRKMNFTIATAGVDVTAVQLKNMTTDTVVDSSLSPDANGDVTVWSGGEELSNTVETIGAGQTVTYGLYGTVSGWSSGDSLTVNIKEDTSAVTNASSASLSDNFIWSDRSVVDHTTTSTDWTNGYLIEDIPGTTSW